MTSKATGKATQATAHRRRSSTTAGHSAWMVARLGVLSTALGVAGWAQQTAAPAASGPAAQSPAGGGTASATVPDRASAYYHFALAHVYEDMATNYGRPDYATRAIEEYKLALNADPNSKFLNSGLAELYLRTGRVREAVLTAQETLKTDPNNLEAHKLLGRVYLQSLGDLQSGGPSEKVLQLAIAEYSKIVELQPNDVESLLLLGQLYTLNHDTQRAEQEFKAAQKIDPGSEDVVLNLARVYGDSGDVRRAIAVLEAVPEDDRTAKIDYALGVSYDQVHDPKKAIEAYSQALDLEPDNLDAERGLAQALLSDNQLDAALKHFQSISTADPQDAQTYLRIAEIQRREGHYEQALATLKKAKSMTSDSLEISFNEALIDEALGENSNAEAILKGLVDQTTRPDGQYSDGDKNNRSVFLNQLANAYRADNKLDLAVQQYQAMIALGGDYEDSGYRGLVDAYRDAKQYDKATQVARQAAQAMPKDKGIQLMLAGQLADTGHVEEGIKLANAQLNGTPQDREAELALAQIYTRLRRWKEAGEELDKAEALATTPDDKIYVYFLRGALEERQKHYDAAETQFRKILAIDADNGMTLNYLGYMLAERGVRLDEALAMAQKAVQLDPQNGAYLDSLGWVYYKMGQYALSEADLRKASEHLSTDPTVHDHLGDLYEKTGRLKLAAAQWEQSIRDYSTAMPGDLEPGDVSKVQKKLESARVKLAKEESTASGSKQ